MRHRSFWSPRASPGGPRPLRNAVLLSALVLLASPARSRAEAPEAFPGEPLLLRVEAHLAGRRAELERLPAHLALIGPVESDRLVAALSEVRVHPSGDGLVIGSAYEPEPHGAGVLALLLAQWRPEGRPARLDDRFFFVPDHRRVALRSLYEGYKRQLFLPVGHEAGTETAHLPRMRFRFPSGGPFVETDAYKLLGLLLAEEDDPSRTWSNSLGQSLSVDAVLGRVQDHYLGQDGRPAGADHTSLHRVELLLAYHRRRPGRVDPTRLEERFLELSVEPRQRSDESVPWTETLGHDVESLGLLAAEPDVRWTADDGRRVGSWLAFLDRGPFRDLERIPLQHLCHLLRGMRLVAEHRDRVFGSRAPE